MLSKISLKISKLVIQRSTLQRSFVSPSSMKLGGAAHDNHHDEEHHEHLVSLFILFK